MKSLTPHQVQRRTNILSTVREQLPLDGYEGLSMRAVANRAGVSPTTLYNLYDSKDGLVLAALQDVLARIGEAVGASGAQGVEQLVRRAEIVGRQIQETPHYARAMTRMMFNADPTDPIALILLRDQMTAHADLLTEMQNLREIRKDTNLEAYARSLTSNGWSPLLLWMRGFVALDDLTDEYVRIHLLTLYPIMMPRVRRRYSELLKI
jgi:AcrR family transcriptional regulator